MIKKIGIIGSGMIGSQVARLSLDAGYDVLISNSRGPESLKPLIEELGGNARAVTSKEAIAEGDIVVLAIPFGIYAQLDPEQYQDKIIIDTMNYYPERDGEMTEVKTETIATSELVQNQLPGSRIVKAINNMDFIRLYKSARPSKASDRSALPIASDDPEAKAIVADFIAKIGYDTVDIGLLKYSWRSEPTTPVYVAPYVSKIDYDLTGAIPMYSFENALGRQVDKNEVFKLLQSATRHNQMHGSMSLTSGT